MTVSPQPPNLVECGEAGFRKLAEPHLTFVKLCFGYSLMVLIGNGFETDGASVPNNNLLYDKTYGETIQNFLTKKFPKIGTRWDFENLFEKLVGEPWDMPRLLAAIVHDALYTCKWKCRWVCDLVYRKILLQNNYDRVRADVEYSLIGLVGWKHWNKVTDLERDRARESVRIEFVRNKKIAKITKQLIAETR